MTLSDYFEQITAINHELRQIAERTKAMGIARTGHPGNQAWENAMDRQWQLIQASAALTAQMLSPTPPAV